MSELISAKRVDHQMQDYQIVRELLSPNSRVGKQFYGVITDARLIEGSDYWDIEIMDGMRPLALILLATIPDLALDEGQNR